MFFSKGQSPEEAAAQAAKLEAEQALQQAEMEKKALNRRRHQKLSETLFILGHSLKTRQFMLCVSHQLAYTAQYLGEVAMFAGRICNEQAENGCIHSDAGKKWFAHELPIMLPTPIEIGPDDFRQYIHLAIQADPLKQLSFPEEAVQCLKQFTNANMPGATLTHQPQEQMTQSSHELSAPTAY